MLQMCDCAAATGRARRASERLQLDESYDLAVGEHRDRRLALEVDTHVDAVEGGLETNDPPDGFTYPTGPTGRIGATAGRSSSGGSGGLSRLVCAKGGGNVVGLCFVLAIACLHEPLDQARQLLVVDPDVARR